MTQANEYGITLLEKTKYPRVVAYDNTLDFTDVRKSKDNAKAFVSLFTGLRLHNEAVIEQFNIRMTAEQAEKFAAQLLRVAKKVKKDGKA